MARQLRTPALTGLSKGVYLPELQHPKAVAKTQFSDDISRHE